MPALRLSTVTRLAGGSQTVLPGRSSCRLYGSGTRRVAAGPAPLVRVRDPSACPASRNCPSRGVGGVGPGTLRRPWPRTRPPPPQMMGPEDAGACSGRNAELLPVPGPMGQDGKTVRATGGFSRGAVAAEPPGEAGEEEAPPPRQLLQRYLAAAAGPLQPGLGGVEAEAAAVPAARGSGMTNGDSGFLLRQDRRGPEEARRRRTCGRPCLAEPADEGVDGAGGLDDWAAPLEDPLRSCCLAAGDTDDPDPTATTSAGRDVGSAESSLGLPDARFGSRNTFEVSRRQSAGDLLPSARPSAPLPAAEQGPGGTTVRARRSGGFADFFARYRTGRARGLGGAGNGLPSGRSGLSFDLSLGKGDRMAL